MPVKGLHAEQLQKRLRGALAPFYSHTGCPSVDPELINRAEAIDPKIEEHQGRIVGAVGDSLRTEFTSVVDAVQ